MTPLSFFQYSFLNKRGIYKGLKKYKTYVQGRVLDFGCGEKPYETMFICDSYTGVDYEQTGHDNTENNIDVYWDGKVLPFEDDSFDSILSIEVFEHVFNLEEILKELHRVLKPGGHLLSTTPFVIHEHEVPYDFARYTHYGLTSLFTRYGFEIVQHKKYGSYFSVIMQLYIWFVGKITTTSWKPLTYLLRLFFGIPTILICNTLGLLGPNMQSGMYLNNVFVLRKII